jgi:hypothetical protein
MAVILTLTGEDDGCGGPRVPVLACADLLRKQGEEVQVVSAGSDAEIDALVTALDGPLVVGAATDGEVRAVVRRMVRYLAPPPSKRPAELPEGRTVFDLPPLAVLPLAPSEPDLVSRLGLPRDPEAVAAAVGAGRTRRLDLLRNDAGSVTLHSSLLGGVDTSGAVGLWRGRVEVDDAVLADGEESLVACSIANAGPSYLDGLPLVAGASPEDGLVDVAVAVPVVSRRRLRKAEMHFEVRRARGRAVSVTPRDEGLHLVDDGVSGTLNRKRSWWVEAGAWAAYVT